MRNRRGWVLMDALCGLLLVGLAGVMLAVGAHACANNMRRIQDIRGASRLAESALEHAEQKQPVNVNVRYLPDETPAAQFQWTEATAKVNGRQATLIGLSPRRSGNRP